MFGSYPTVRKLLADGALVMMTFPDGSIVPDIAPCKAIGTPVTGYTTLQWDGDIIIKLREAATIDEIDRHLAAVERLRTELAQELERAERWLTRLGWVRRIGLGTTPVGLLGGVMLASTAAGINIPGATVLAEWVGPLQMMTYASLTLSAIMLIASSAARKLLGWRFGG
jgi:hypothetical protein